MVDDHLIAESEVFEWSDTPEEYRDLMRVAVRAHITPNPAVKGTDAS